ncbi:hypothetical protein ACIBQ6_21885 [Nonomuraea sp. NPDC049655]|uniref:hypothetical protein n=1 Tax=Nonomuraea sp. NPDC049655 TaxID=3364355 RepID=UPI003787CD9D
MNNDEQPAGSPPAELNQAAIDWAWSQPVANNPGARIALLCLARRVDEAWECTASQEEVAVDAMVATRSMRRYLDQLEEDGFIVRRRRVSDTGHRLPDRYRLNPAQVLPANVDGRQVNTGESYRPIWPVANLAAGADQEKSLPANLDARDGTLWPDWPVGETAEAQTRRSQPVANLPTGQIGRAIGVSSSSSSEEEHTPSTTKGGAGGKSRSSDKEHPRFAEWYAAYPLHDKRPQAVKAFNKAVAKVDDPQILIDGATRYATHDPRVQRGYIKGPSVWLNNECWNDPIPPDPEQQRPPVEGSRAGNGSGSFVPPRGARQNPFRSKRESA